MMISIVQQGKDEYLLFVNEDDGRMEKVLDAYAQAELGKDDYPSAGYSADLDADAYRVNTAQLLTFIETWSGRKRVVTEAQRQARRQNARKATSARQHTKRQKRES